MANCKEAPNGISYEDLQQEVKVIYLFFSKTVSSEELYDVGNICEHNRYTSKLKLGMLISSNFKFKDYEPQDEPLGRSPPQR